MLNSYEGVDHVERRPLEVGHIYGFSAWAAPRPGSCCRPPCRCVLTGVTQASPSPGSPPSRRRSCSASAAGLGVTMQLAQTQQRLDIMPRHDHRHRRPRLRHQPAVPQPARPLLRWQASSSDQGGGDIRMIPDARFRSTAEAGAGAHGRPDDQRSAQELHHRRRAAPGAGRHQPHREAGRVHQHRRRVRLRQIDPAAPDRRPGCRI